MTKAKSTALASSILTSSIWLEPSDIRVVWITLLALANREGKVKATIKKLAEVANVSIEAATQAVQIFSSPDDRSRSDEERGKRIEVLADGFRIINFSKYNHPLKKVRAAMVGTGVTLDYYLVQAMKLDWYKYYKTSLSDLRLRRELNELGNENKAELSRAFREYIKTTPAQFFSWNKFRDTWRSFLPTYGPDARQAFEAILSNPSGRSASHGPFWSLHKVREEHGDKAANAFDAIGGHDKFVTITTANKPFIFREFEKAYV